MEFLNHPCGQKHIVFDNELQAYVCTKCGLVLEDHPIYQGHESIDREKEGSLRYSGAFTLRVHDHGVGSTEISGNLKRHIKQGRTWVARNLDVRVDKEDRKLVKALRELNDLVRQTNAPRAVAETAAKILREAMKELNNIKAQTMRRVIVASLYLAYKICGIPRPARVFARELGISESDLWEGIRKIRETCRGLEVAQKNPEPRHYIEYIVNQLKMPPRVAALAMEILSKMPEEASIGKNPVALAAAAVYVAGILYDHRRNQLEVGSIIGQTDVAIRNAYDTLIKSLDIEVLL